MAPRAEPSVAHAITRIAYEAGFPNAASLGRAFKARIGQTPAAFRQAQGSRWAMAAPSLAGDIGQLASREEDPSPERAVRHDKG